MLNFSNIDQILHDADFPAAFVDYEAFQNNIAVIKQYFTNKQLKVRICSKSIRCGPLIQEIFNSSDVFIGVMSYSIGDAIYLSKNFNINDIIIAYPAVNKHQINKLCQYIAQKEKEKSPINISPMVDCETHVKTLSEFAKQHKIQLEVIVDVDVSYKPIELHPFKLGVNRSPLRDNLSVLKLLKTMDELDNIHCRGIMGYEAQNAATPDYAAEKVFKFFSQSQVNARRQNLIDYLKNKGYNINIVNGGGSGSYQETTKNRVITEVGIGSAFYKSWIFDDFINLKNIQPSLFFALEVVRKPSEDVITCFSGGYIASGASRNPPKIVYPKGLSTLKMEGFGEVQTPIKFDKKKYPLDIGSKIIIRPAKAGEPLERFNKIYIIKNRKVIKTLNTFRGDHNCFG